MKLTSLRAGDKVLRTDRPCHVMLTFDHREPACGGQRAYNWFKSQGSGTPENPEGLYWLSDYEVSRHLVRCDPDVPVQSPHMFVGPL